MFQNNLKNEEKRYLLAEKYTKETKGATAGAYGSTSTDEKPLPECTDNTDDETSGDTLEISLFPTPVIFVLLSKTFEATAANGVRSVLSLFLKNSLHLDERFSIVILHTFNFFSQFLPICGAIISDVYLGNAKTVSIFFIPYAMGCIGIFASTIFSVNTLVYSSLLLIAVGNGFLRACIASLGAKQYILPQQQVALDRYFSAYYFFYYAGILVGKVLPPYVRTSILITPYCVEKQECYVSVFGVLGLTFLISWILFLCGLRSYRRECPTFENTMLKTADCISYAIMKKFDGESARKGFLENAVGRYSQEFVNDVKIFMKILKVFLPLPIYYALLNQQDSTWTFQATLTDTNILGIKVQADQFKAIGPVLLLLLIPVWQKVVNPLLEKCGIFLSSIGCVFIGCLFASLSFVCAGFLQHFIVINDGVQRYSILWQFPQFFLIMLAETLISIPGLKFAYTHAPKGMKSVMTAIFFINNALGNLLVVVITQLGFFNDNHSMEFFFYALMMLAGAILIKILAPSEDNEHRPNASEEQTYEAFIYANEVQTANMEENSAVLDA